MTRGRLIIECSGDRFDRHPAGHLACCMATCTIGEQVEPPQVCECLLIWWFTEGNAVLVVLSHVSCVRAACSVDAQSICPCCARRVLLIHCYPSRHTSFPRLHTKRPSTDEVLSAGALKYSNVCKPESERSSENKNASNSRLSLPSVARSYQHKALGELHRQ